MIQTATFVATILAALGVAPCAQAAPNPTSRALQTTPNGEGFHDGYFYHWWSDGGAPASYANGNAGAYQLAWETGGNLFGGKGWKSGNPRNISYAAEWKPVNDGNSYLSIYGYTKNPQVDYYIIESHGSYDPCSKAEVRGTIDHAGSTYKLCSSRTVTWDGTLSHYYAVRRDQRTRGTVDTGVIFAAWAEHGMPLGKHEYQLVATEAYFSTGSSSVVIDTPAEA
ncbi:endo--beta-xylanase i precursor [Apiospora arundinis]